MKKNARKKFDQKKEVRAIARERVGAVKPSHAICSQDRHVKSPSTKFRLEPGSEWRNEHAMPFVKVGTVAQLPPGSVMQVDVGGNAYAVCNVGGELHALDGDCPHSGGPLGEGALHGIQLGVPLARLGVRLPHRRAMTSTRT